MPFGTKEIIIDNFQVLINIKKGQTSFTNSKQRTNTKSIYRQRLRNLKKNLKNEEELLSLWNSYKIKLKQTKKEKRVLFYENSYKDFLEKDSESQKIGKVEISISERPVQILNYNQSCYNQWMRLYTEFKEITLIKNKSVDELILIESQKEKKEKLSRQNLKIKEIRKELTKSGLYQDQDELEYNAFLIVSSIRERNAERLNNIKEALHKKMFTTITEENPGLTSELNFLGKYLQYSEKYKSNFCGCEKKKKTFYKNFLNRRKKHRTTSDENFEDFMNGHYRYHIIMSYREPPKCGCKIQLM